MIYAVLSSVCRPLFVIFQHDESHILNSPVIVDYIMHDCLDERQIMRMI